MASPFRVATKIARRSLHTQQPSSLALAFDIDGVLVRGPQALPAAKRALKIVRGDNPFNCEIPHILLTNGGGESEEARCRKLGSKLGFPIRTNQYVQAHTILKTWSHRYANEPVLVLGGKYDVVRRVAQSYGFKQVYTTLDILRWKPSVWPLHELSEEERASTVEVDFAQTRISAIFVFHDPRNWALDVQVMCDLILSHGIVGAPPPIPSTSLPKPVEVVFCNPDLLWRSDFPRSRLGQGGFKEAFHGVFKAMTGSSYEYQHIQQLGKPTKPTYEFARSVLQSEMELLHTSPKCPSVYMIGDNPESDIAGANAAGWQSILVHTGVYDPKDGPPAHTPTYQAADVEMAVRWAIDRELQQMNGSIR